MTKSLHFLTLIALLSVVSGRRSFYDDTSPEDDYYSPSPKFASTLKSVKTVNESRNSNTAKVTVTALPIKQPLPQLTQLVLNPKKQKRGSEEEVIPLALQGSNIAETGPEDPDLDEEVKRNRTKAHFKPLIFSNNPRGRESPPSEINSDEEAEIKLVKVTQRPRSRSRVKAIRTESASSVKTNGRRNSNSSRSGGIPQNYDDMDAKTERNSEFAERMPSRRPKQRFRTPTTRSRTTKGQTPGPK